MNDFGLTILALAVRPSAAQTTKNYRRFVATHAQRGSWFGGLATGVVEEVKPQLLS